MVAPRLAESSDAPGPEHPSELAQHFRLVRHVMKSVEADDPVDGFICQFQPVAVEPEKPRRQQLTSERRVLFEELSAYVEGGRRRVAADHGTVQLRDQARQPTRPRAEIKDGHRFAKMQPAQERAQVFEHLWCFVYRLKGLAQGQIRILHHSIVLVGGLVQLCDRVAPHHFLGVDE